MNYVNSFLNNFRRSVYKWWCVVYKPVYKLMHHGYWPNEKNPYATGTAYNEKKQAKQSHDEPELSAASSPDSIAKVEATSNQVAPKSDVDEDALRRANEIMARLANEAAEDEAKKQSEIDKAKEYAAEQEKLANIMNANKVDISIFIEEGRNSQKDE